MKTTTIRINPFAHQLKWALLCLAAFLFAGSGARAGLTFDLHLIRFSQGQAYRFFTPLDTNSIAPDAAFGTYIISSPLYSPAQSTNGSVRVMELSSGGINTISGTENSYYDFNSMMQQITNGTWSILFTNATTTNFYTFTVSAPGVTSNMLPATIITYPTSGALSVPNQPTLTWQGPTNWPGFTVNTYISDYDFSVYEPTVLPTTQTNWMVPTPIPDGVDCNFNLEYQTNNNPPIFVITTPLNTNSSHAAIAGWLATDTLDTGHSLSFAITNPPVATPVLVAHYTFDNSGNLGQDSSGKGYNLDFNGGNGVTSTNDAKAGSGAAYFDGNSFFTYTSAPTNVMHTLVGDFSISFWIKTTQDSGNGNGPAWAGAGIVAADAPGLHYDLVPAALDGGQIGFNTGGDFDDTVNSTVDINNTDADPSGYYHVVVTRNESTGEKQVYINGVLDNSDFATMNPLSDPRAMAVGCAIDASESDPNNFQPSQYFQGTLDDLQIYAGVLSPNQVTSLFNNPGSSLGGSSIHALVGHYNFDNSNSAGQDSSGKGNDINQEITWGPEHQFSSDAIAGGGSVRFFGTDGLFASDEITTNLDALLAGSFSFSVWVKTTATNGADDSDAFDGAVIFWAYNDHNNTNDTIPLSITGGKAAFSTRDHLGNQDTLHSVTSVNDGAYHLITVTRDQFTGLKRMYVDGLLESSQTGTSEPLNGNNYYLSISGYAYVHDFDNTHTNFGSYNGLLDDLQVYSGVLSGSDVAYIYTNRGSSVADNTGGDLNAALNTTGLSWTTSGDADWFVETNMTHDGASAMQSGGVTNDQTSTLSVTVTGPGTLTFFWSSIANDPNEGFDYQFNIDGTNRNDISGNNDWSQDGPYNIEPGQHTLSWTVFANGDTDATEAGFLDEVNFLSTTIPVITFNPFNQTNYPGYPVWLNAGATSNPNASWQWYKLGSGLISGATNSYFTPANSGTANVAGNYYAIASTDLGSAITTTAAVSFVSAPLPPDWTRAFKSPFDSADDEQITRDFYYGCFVDASSNIYTAAEFGGSMTVGSQHFISGPGGDAAAVMKQSPTGAPLWAAALTNNGNGNSYSLCVAPTPDGGVYVSGNCGGTNWLGTNKIIDAGSGDIFVARFDANGSNVWLKTFGGPSSDFMVLNSLASDSAGNIVLCGLLGAGPVTLGNSNYTVVGQQGVLFQLGQNGAVLWSDLLPGEFPQGLLCNSGRVYMSLNTVANDNATNVVIGSISNLTDRAWAVACVDESNGHAIWAQGVGARSGSGDGNPYSTGVNDDVPRLAISGTNLFLTGVAYDSTARFGPITVNFTLPRGQYFARYDTNGNPQIATTYGSVTTTPVAAVANARGEVYVSGDFDTYSFFGNDMIAAPAHQKQFIGGFSQSFLAKFDANGNPLWAREAISPSVVNFRGIALASDDVWASGWGTSSNTFAAAQAITFGTNSVFTDRLALVGGPGSGVFFLFFPGGILAKVTESAAVAQPITLVNSRNSGTNFQFSFQSQSGFTHSVEYRTNLISGLNWQTYSNVMGDGSLQTIPIPYSVFSPSKVGFIRVETH